MTKPSRKRLIPQLILAATLAACSDEADHQAPQYGTSRAALSEDDQADHTEEEGGGACAGVPSEPSLVHVALDIVEHDVLVSVDNTLDAFVAGAVELRVDTNQGSKTTLVPFEVRDQEDVAISVPLDSLGVDVADELAVVTAVLSGTVEDGRTTVSSDEVLYDVRPAKPELDEPDERGAASDGVTVAFVTEGIASDRVAAGRDGSATRGLGRPQTAALVNKTLCFDATLTLPTAAVGEDTFAHTTHTIYAAGQRMYPSQYGRPADL